MGPQIETVGEVALEHDGVRAEQPVHAPGHVQTLGERGDRGQDGVHAQQHEPVLLQDVRVLAMQAAVLGAGPLHRLADQHVGQVVALLRDAEQRDQLQHVDDVTLGRCVVPVGGGGERPQRPLVAAVMMVLARLYTRFVDFKIKLSFGA